MINELYSYNAIMVAHAGEVGIKSKTTRRFMIKVLHRNISTKFPDFELNFKNIANRSIALTENAETLAQNIADIIFGVSYTAPIYFFKWSTYEHLTDKFIKYASQFMKPGLSFGFEARTSGKDRPSSMQLKVDLGSLLYEFFNGSISVNLTNPDHLFSVEVRDEFAWIYHERIQGLDGFPQGAQKGIIYGNIRYWLNDYIATYLTMKRGVNVIPIRFITTENPTLEEQSWHEQFLQKFSFRKGIDIPIHGLLAKWKESFGTNLCSACMFFSESILAKVSNQKNAIGFVSGVKSTSLNGDITEDVLKWFENQNSYFKIRPILILDTETITKSKNFSTFKSNAPCCLFQKMRLFNYKLSAEEQDIVETQVKNYAENYFGNNLFSIDQNEEQ